MPAPVLCGADLATRSHRPQFAQMSLTGCCGWRFDLEEDDEDDGEGSGVANAGNLEEDDEDDAEESGVASAGILVQPWKMCMCPLAIFTLLRL